MTPQDLASHADQVYRASAGLIQIAPDDRWDWKPEAGDWMTLGQLCCHLTSATGSALKGLITGDWGVPDGVAMTEEEILPAAENLPRCSKAEALTRLEDDRLLMHEMLDTLPLEDFDHRKVTAPWGESGPLWNLCLEMVDHQVSHKMQLFQYLKRLGLPIGTQHLYGMQ